MKPQPRSKLSIAVAVMMLTQAFSPAAAQARASVSSLPQRPPAIDTTRCETTADIVPYASPFSVPLGDISGTVRDKNGNPMADIRVSATGYAAGSFGVNQATLTDALGRYAIHQLPLTANSRGGPLPVAYWTFEFHPLDPEANFTPTVCTGIILKQNIPQRLDAILLRSGQILGKVTDEDTGVPIPGVTITATTLMLERSAMTDSAGLYTITNVSEGNYLVKFTPGPGGYFEEYFDDIINLYGSVDVTYASIAPETTFTASADLRRTRDISVELSGLVTDFDTGAPLDGVLVTIPFSRDQAKTDATGHYSLTIVPGGLGLLFEPPQNTALVRGYYPETSQSCLYSDPPCIGIKHKGTLTVNMQLHRGSSISGRAPLITPLDVSVVHLKKVNSNGRLDSYVYSPASNGLFAFTVQAGAYELYATISSPAWPYNSTINYPTPIIVDGSTSIRDISILPPPPIWLPAVFRR